MYDAEHRIIKALPKLAKAATCEEGGSCFLKPQEGNQRPGHQA